MQMPCPISTEHEGQPWTCAWNVSIQVMVAVSAALLHVYVVQVPLMGF